jgi:bifunctional UDP-N-acetylglucosamine pyrophosphorylase/glucosamine-1-phosphate N-acetyltransferase
MSRIHKIAAAILAAGQGTRMGSDLPKALLDLGGRPIIGHVLDAVKAAGIEDIVVVIGHRGDLVQREIGNGVRYAVQDCQRGTAHALMCARPALADFSGYVFALYCDVPFVPVDLLQRLALECETMGAAAAMVTVELDEPSHYGRIIRDSAGHVIGIKEAAGATPEELAIKEINAGIYCFEAPLIFDIAAEIQPDPVKGELYLTDAIGLLAAKGYGVAVIKAEDPAVVMGVNTPAELEDARATMSRIRSSRRRGDA